MYNTNKQKTFFFCNEEWRKILSSAGTNVQHTIDPADIPKAGTDLTYVAPGFATAQPGGAEHLHQQPVLAIEDRPAGPAVSAQHRPLPGNKIPASLFDSDGLLYLQLGHASAGHQRGRRTRTRRRLRTRSTVLDTVLRIDHKFNDKWAILGHYMHDSVTQGYAAAELGWLWASYNTITSTLSNPSQSRPSR